MTLNIEFLIQKRQLPKKIFLRAYSLLFLNKAQFEIAYFF